MPTVDEAWATIYGPAQNLKENARSEQWDVSRARLLDELDGNDPVVVELVRRLDELPDGERGDLLTGDQLDAFVYQVIEETAVPNPDPVSTGADASPGGDEVAGAFGAVEDEAAWGEFLATNGPAWDGSAQAWPAFREWFAYYAAQGGVAAHATALLDYLESLPVSERVATLASHYGVVIAQPSVVTGPDSVAGSAAVTLDPQTEQRLSSALERGLAAVPGARDLSPADIEDVLARVRDALHHGAAK
ncbi:MAG TPA: hypothetical protein VFU73_01585 [Actinocrinis sp.]|nr:hypothetical protein [Actinocrinis sp.]